jgi:hypothetical protein
MLLLVSPARSTNWSRVARYSRLGTPRPERGCVPAPAIGCRDTADSLTAKSMRSTGQGRPSARRTALFVSGGRDCHKRKAEEVNLALRLASQTRRRIK